MKRWLARLTGALHRGKGSESFPVELRPVADRFFDDSSRSEASPELVLLYGCVASGKTTYRQRHFASGYVALDAGEVFAALGYGSTEAFPPADPTRLNRVGSAIAERALRERRNLVIELVSNYPDQLDQVLAAMQRHGYTVRVVVLECAPEEAVRRNDARGTDSVSAYFGQSFHLAWLLGLAR